jgi:hypothetical protein
MEENLANTYAVVCRKMEASECIAYSLRMMDDVVVSWFGRAKEFVLCLCVVEEWQVGRSFERYIKEIGGLVKQGLSE